MEIGVILLKSKSLNRGPVGCGVIHTLTKVFLNPYLLIDVPELV